MKDKICVLTGASSGIGYGVALSLSVMNAVSVLLSRNNQRGRETYRKLHKIDGNVEWLPADLSSKRSVREFAEQFSIRYGKCDCCSVVPVYVTAKQTKLLFPSNLSGCIVAMIMRWTMNIQQSQLYYTQIYTLDFTPLRCVCQRARRYTRLPPSRAKDWMGKILRGGQQWSQRFHHRRELSDSGQLCSPQYSASRTISVR